jgi:hypothetical protein
MWIGVLSILCCYGVSIALLHLFIGNRGDHARKDIQVLLITKDNQAHIEWYVRSLFFVSRLRGRHLKISILDEGSSDETLKIARRLSHTYSVNIDECASEKSVEDYLLVHEDEKIIIAHIANQEELIKIPLLIQ